MDTSIVAPNRERFSHKTKCQDDHLNNSNENDVEMDEANSDDMPMDLSSKKAKLRKITNK